MNQPPEKSPGSRYAAYDHAEDAVHSAGPSQPVSRHAAEWGLASLLTSGVLFATSVPFIILAVVTQPIGRQVYTRNDVSIITTLVTLAAIAIGIVLAMSILAGLISMISALVRKQPLGLGCLGFLMSALALGFWICGFVAAFAVLEDLGTIRPRY